MEYKILVVDRGYHAVVKLEGMVIKTCIEHRRNIATLSTTTIKTNSSTLINPVESFVKFLPSTTIKWDTSDGYYLCYQADSLLMWVILEDQNEKYYRDMYEEQKRHVEIYKKNIDILKQNHTDHVKRIAISHIEKNLLQDKLDATAGAMLTSKKECERITAELTTSQKEFKKIVNKLEKLTTEHNELSEDLKIYISNELVYQKNIDIQKRKIEKLKKLLDD